MPDIFSYFRPYDSRNYRSVSGNTQPRQKSQPKPVTATWKPGDYSNTIFRRYVETGNPESFPTWSQFQWIYPHSTKADYESARANAPVRQQSAPVANPTPVNYSRYIPSSGTNYIMAGAPAPSMGRTAAPATDWDALHSRLGEPTAVDYMTADGLSSDRNSTSRTATPPASTPKTGTAVAAKPGETVAAMWTRVTGLPWKTAKEMGLTDGSYAQNIEILKGLKSGSITKDSIYSRIANQAVTPAETVDLSGMQRTDDYEPVPEAAPVTESGTPYTRAMANGGFIRRYVPEW